MGRLFLYPGIKKNGNIRDKLGNGMGALLTDSGKFHEKKKAGKLER
jgi:hypothetical protein